MGLSHLFFLMLLYSGLGTFFGLGLVSQRTVGRSFYLYHGLTISAVTLVAFVFYRDLVLAPLDIFLLSAFTVASGAFALTAGHWPSVARLFHSVGLAFAVTFIFRSIPAQPGVSQLTANALLGSVLLGVAITALSLGYWRGASRPIVRETLKLSLLLLAIVLVRCLYSGLSLHLLLSGKSGVEVSRIVLSATPGSLLLLRGFWGLLGPLLLSGLILAAMRGPSHSAKGLFFVAVLCLIAGEALSQYLAYYHGIAF